MDEDELIRFSEFLIRAANFLDEHPALDAYPLDFQRGYQKAITVLRGLAETGGAAMLAREEATPN